MSDFDYRMYLYETLCGIQDRCLEMFGCRFFPSAYLCRKFLRTKDYMDVMTVRVTGAYMPMTRDAYREWRRLKRKLSDLNSK